MVDASVLPQEEIRVPLIVLQCLPHQEELGHHHCVVEVECVLRMPLFLFPVRKRFLVPLPDPFDQWVVPHAFEPLEFPFDENVVGPLPVLFHEQLELFVAENDEVGLRLQQHPEVLEVVLETATEIVLHRSSLDVPQPGDDCRDCPASPRRQYSDHQRDNQPQPHLLIN